MTTKVNADTSGGLKLTSDTSGTLELQSAGNTKLTVNSSGATIPTITGLASINSGQIGGRRNIVINGEMKVAQRATSVTGLGAAGGYFTLDRWMMDGAASAGRYTMAQVADGPAGFANCLKLTTTTADTSIAADEFLTLQTRFEGQDLQQLKKGTASAEQVTVSFYVKGNAAALYVCELFDGDNSRSITQSFAVTTSWNRIELTFAADTSDPLDDDNAASLYLIFWLHAGSNFTSGTFAVNTWNDRTNANRYAVANRTSIFDATSRTFFITGVQMEIGTQATDFESRSYGEELALCQRYCTKIAPATNAGVGTGFARTTTTMYAARDLPVHMRTTPTLAFSSATDFQIQYLGSVITTTAMAASELSADTIAFQATVGSAALTAGQGMYLRDLNGGATIIASAEL